MVTGLGVVAPNGIGVERFWEANLGGVSGVSRIDCFDASHYPSRIAAQVRGFDPARYMPERLARRVDRFVHLGLGAAAMALEDSHLALEREDPERIGVIMGSGLGGALFHEEQMMSAYERASHRFNPLCVPRITPNAVAAHVAIQYGFLGPNMVISTACASGNHAIGEAFRKIRGGETDIMIAGGAEAPLTQFTFGAYCALRGVLSTRNHDPQGASRPFDRDRDGFVMGEGAAALVLEDLRHARLRDAPIYAEILAYAASSGAYHMAAPEPEGEDAARTMRRTLQEAGIDPAQVDYINAHGTGTIANDRAETRAINKVFGPRRVPVSSTKSMIGHTIGAAGAIEAVVCCLALRHQILPPTINYANPDPECDIDCVPNQPRPADITIVLSNSFGFGSVNACLLLARPGACALECPKPDREEDPPDDRSHPRDRT